MHWIGEGTFGVARGARMLARGTDRVHTMAGGAVRRTYLRGERRRTSGYRMVSGRCEEARACRDARIVDGMCCAGDMGMMPRLFDCWMGVRVWTVSVVGCSGERRLSCQCMRCGKYSREGGVG